MTSNGHISAKVFVLRSIQRIKDTEKVAYVKRVNIEIPENRIIEAIKSIGIDVTNVARLQGKDGKTSTRTVRITFVHVANRNTFVRNGLQVDDMHFEAQAATQSTKPTNKSVPDAAKIIEKTNAMPQMNMSSVPAAKAHMKLHHRTACFIKIKKRR